MYNILQKGITLCARKDFEEHVYVVEQNMRET